MDEAIREVFRDHISVRPIQPEELSRWEKLVNKYHYLKNAAMVGESLRYVAEQNGQWIALLGWSSAAFHLQPRDRWIGWNHTQRHARRHLVACNARFVILPEGQPGLNQASKIMSLNLARLSQDWQTAYDHPILLAETFIDPDRFEGTCYRAAN
jgi:hypothetical protein